jgi:hypothetical protein
MLVKNLLGNSVLLHPHNMTQVLQPPLLYLRNEFELPIEFVDSSFALMRHSPCSKTAPKILRRNFLSHTRSRFLSHSERIHVSLPYSSTGRWHVTRRASVL